MKVIKIFFKILVYTKIWPNEISSLMTDKNNNKKKKQIVKGISENLILGHKPTSTGETIWKWKI